MLEAFLLLTLVGLFALGYGTRSYVGALIPGAVLVWVAILYLQRQPSTPSDEVDVLPGLFLVASVVGVLLYLGGVALGRRARRQSSHGAQFR